MKITPRAFLLLVYVLALPVYWTYAESKPNKIPDVAVTALEQADQLEIYSLDPNKFKAKDKKSFHGWKILGKKIIDGDKKTELVKAFEQSVLDSDAVYYRSIPQPEYGIRVKHEGNTIDFVICFESLRTGVYINESHEMIFNTTSPKELFNNLLGIKLKVAPAPAVKAVPKKSPKVSAYLEEKIRKYKELTNAITDGSIKSYKNSAKVTQYFGQPDGVTVFDNGSGGVHQQWRYMNPDRNEIGAQFLHFNEKDELFRWYHSS